MEGTADLTRHSTIADVVVDRQVVEKQPRCLCCDGVIAGGSDQAASVGLDLSLGLVSDECALICNDCTTRLIEARAMQPDMPRKRR